MQSIKLPSEILTQKDIDRLNNMFEESKTKQSNELVSFVKGLALMCPVISKHFYNIRSEVDAMFVRTDQSFMGYRPSVSERFPEATLMIYHTMAIGIGVDNDVHLQKFGNCNYVSPRHAIIFYNDVSQQYELLNYSRHGTYVNNTLYRNKEFRTKDDSYTVRNNRRTKKHKIAKSKKHAIDLKMTAIDRHSRMKCSCTPDSLECVTSEWEGSIVINHGTVLSFGCITFVFSTLNLPLARLN